MDFASELDARHARDAAWETIDPRFDNSTVHLAEIAVTLRQRGIRPDHLNALADDRWQAVFVNPGGTLTAIIEAQIERLDADPFVILDERRGKHAMWVTFQEVG